MTHHEQWIADVGSDTAAARLVTDLTAHYEHLGYRFETRNGDEVWAFMPDEYVARAQAFVEGWLCAMQRVETGSVTE